MNTLKKNFYTPSELAHLAGISKQLLLHYDKIQILSPKYVDENGYRYYSLSQFFVLQVIIMLRKLDLPLKDIKEYLDKEDPEMLQGIYARQIQEYKNRIRQYEKYTELLQEKITQLSSINSIRTNEILLERRCEQKLFLSPPIPLNIDIKERMNILAEHMRLPLVRQTFTDTTMGFFIPSSSFLKGESAPEYRVFLTDISNFSKAGSVHSLEEGLYLSVYSHVRFGLVDLDTRNKINDFVKRNGLLVQSDAYIFPLTNYWSTANSLDELSQILIKVAYP